MAITRNITADDRFYFDTDRVIEFAIYAGTPTIDEIEASTAVPQDVAGWTFAFQVRKKVSDALPKIDKQSGDGISIIGTYNVDPDINTQRVQVTIEDSDTYDPTPASGAAVDLAPGDYVYALKRLGEGTETILVEGTFTLLKVAAWE